MKKIFALIIMLIVLVPIADADELVILNTDTLRIGDNSADLKISWVREFNIPEDNVTNAQLMVESRDVNNGDQPIRINGVLIGQLNESETDQFTTVIYPVPNGTLVMGDNTISITTTITGSLNDYDDVYIQLIELTYKGDSDGDEIADDVDNCPDDPNPNQSDADGDGTGDACDDCTDTDDDGYGNPGYPNPGCDEDNCPDDPNPSQADSDSDAIGNACEQCFFSRTLGEDSITVEYLRSYRDNVLTKTPEGRKLIKLYYQWSPVIVNIMDGDEDFMEEMISVIDEVVPICMGTVD